MRIANTVLGLESTTVSMRPRITAKRQQIDNRFPFLAFAIDTLGLPLYEVLLTTDRALFSPSRKADRRADNFYSSREDSGLIGKDAESYSAPPAVLQRFANARAIYFTVISYRDQNLGGAMPADSPEELARSAPSVEIVPGFRGSTLGMVLSVPLSKLRTVGTSYADDEDVQTSLAAPADANEDRGEREDGYGLALEAFDDAGEHAPYEAQAAQADLASADYDDGYGPSAGSLGADADTDGEDIGTDPGGYAHAHSASYEAPLASPYEAPLDEGELSASDLAMNSVFPAGTRPPAMLEDDGHRMVDDADAQDALALGYRDGYESAPLAEPMLQPLTVSERRRIIDAVAAQTAPGRNPYATVGLDAEFAGHVPGHPAAGRYHVGLSYGNAQFTQDSGNLGRLLREMNRIDGERFAQVFGPRASELLALTQAPGPDAAHSPDGRGARVQPVGGRDLWESPWVERFVDAARPDLFGAGQPQRFNGEQNKLASALFLDPMLPFSRWLDVNTDRGLAMLMFIAQRLGVEPARDWIMRTAGPIQSHAQRQQALASLGYASLPDFQHATAGLEADHQWGPTTHAAMVAALRHLGTRSPLPIPSGKQVLDAIANHAPSAVAAQLTELRRTDSLRDVPYSL
ncbi:hypothetical protein [Burkholderia ubonensis]|uniref:hypothetical protein n=1 Tax=Burkholderia ubonensis TaxID=101571 RepID=UPI00075FDA32|nr:hypothetical protein [Burkholderia ubonensis]KWO12086.1 hypothetical protein WM27_03530 [Burkholderia ubonensis]